MALWWNRKSNLVEIAPPKPEELMSMMDALSTGGLPMAIEREIQKMIDASAYFQAYESGDDQGNYFGSEFNIRATAGRIKSTYTREPWVFTTATLLAKTLSSVPMQVLDARSLDPLPDHPLSKRLTMGNRLQDSKSIEWNGGLDLLLGGNFFRVFNETFTEMMQVPVELVSLIISPDKKSIDAIRIWDNQTGAYGTTIPYRQVIHHKFPNPNSPYYGLSLFIACSRPILMDRYKNEFEMAFYLRGASSSGVIETTEDISKERMKRLMRSFESVFTGKRNWFRTIFLPRGAKWVNAGLTMTDMQHLEGLRENRLTILAALGIPPSKVGLVQDVNRSTSDNQDKDFWENTVKPLAEFMAAGWNNSYLVKVIYSGAVVVAPDFSGITAMQGSIKQKGEEAKAVEPYLLINEIRTDILGYDPLPPGDERGNKFVSEIRPAQAPGALGLSVATDPVSPITAPGITDPVQDVVGDTTLDMKGRVINSQERIEKRLGAEYIDGYAVYEDEFLTLAVHGLNKGIDVEAYLNEQEKHLAKVYIDAVQETLIKAMERGFAFANSQSKSLSYNYKRKTIVAEQKKFNETDQQAVDVLRDKQRDGQRTTLVRRGITNFQGFNKTNTKRAMDIIANGLAKGQTMEQVAATLRGKYAEAYKDQAFTIARTETLSAISQGMKWNHDVLGDIFSKIQKRWFHVGDIGTNPHARYNHYLFEQEGPVDQGHIWGGTLEYPRDPSAPADEVINCRCSMVSIVPDDATSNAEIILDKN